MISKSNAGHFEHNELSVEVNDYRIIILPTRSVACKQSYSQRIEN